MPALSPALDTTPAALDTSRLGSTKILPSTPADPRPVQIYLASLSEGPGRVGMASALDTVARRLSAQLGIEATRETWPWVAMRYEHLAALRSMLAAEYAPNSANKMLSAVRGVLKVAWRLDLLDTDTYIRAADVPNIKGTRLTAGRALSPEELRALFAACADGLPAGARDAAAFALMFGAGLRRSEAVAVTVTEYDADTGALRVIGKGNKERKVFLTSGGQAALIAWLKPRGCVSGPILCPVSKGGTIAAGSSMTSQALMNRLKARCKQANIKECSPHDLRRTYVSEMLAAGADLAVVQRNAGHASPTTTARYDRRGEEAQQQVAALLHVPFVSTEITSPTKAQ